MHSIANVGKDRREVQVMIEPMLKGLRLILFAGLVLATAFVATAIAQSGTKRSAGAETGDGEAKVVAPKRTVIRFLTDSDYPPFNYRDEEGVLTGFNVDVARAVCLELDVTCDIQARAWDELLGALNNGEADAVIASLAITPQTLRDADFTQPYYFTPARFAARRDTAKLDMTPKGLESKRVAVVHGSAHEAYIDTFFRDCIIVPFDDIDGARSALAAGKVDLLFGDGMSLVFWLNGTLSRGCCEFRGGAFSEPKYFGEGVAIAVRKGDTELLRSLNKALAKVQGDERYEELFLRYFPLKVY